MAYHEAGHAVIEYRFRKWIRERGIFSGPPRHGMEGGVQLLDVLPRDAKWHRSVGGAVWESFVKRAEREIIISNCGADGGGPLPSRA